MNDYVDFLASKQVRFSGNGINPDNLDFHDALFPFQRDLVKYACIKGRCAIFADTGLGKTIMGAEYARLMGGTALIVAPLAVAYQYIEEVRAVLDYEIKFVTQTDELKPGINITNYEKLDHFDVSGIDVVVLDESSILKNMSGATKQKLVEMFSITPYRLCTSATPAPNDITEIANHAEFLGIMSRQEMLSIFFTYNNSEGTSKASSWRLKKHAVNDFYYWLSSWGMAVKKPSDLGYDDDDYVLPPMTVEVQVIDTDYTPKGMLPGMFGGAISAIDAKKIRRQTVADRGKILADEINNDPDSSYLVWVALNAEAEDLIERIPDAVNVEGKMSERDKAETLLRFARGEIRVLITKTSIAGMGLNFQCHCHKVRWNGIDYSFEQFYQGNRRVWRFGQSHPVDVKVITSRQESMIYDIVQQKSAEAERMVSELVSHAANYAIRELNGMTNKGFEYKRDKTIADSFTMHLGDSVEIMPDIPDNSVDLSVYSPPFSDLFVYSATPRDLGNSKTMEEFFEHYKFIIRENLRITRPGRIACVHVQDTRSLKGVDGFAGRKDFSGMVIEAYQREGWIFFQRITIDKNPQAQAIRLKDHGLLFKTLKKDSTGLSGGHADYLLIFKKPGDNETPVTPFQNGEVSNDDWILWAHPVWYDIRESDTLNVAVARSEKDEKHMCPLQLPLIERCVRLWSNPGEVVFSPFAGIGSEGYEAIKRRRKFLGIELKPEYYKVAIQNLRNATMERGQSLFEWADQKES